MKSDFYIAVVSGITLPHTYIQKKIKSIQNECHSCLPQAQCHYLRITILTNSGSPPLLQNALSSDSYRIWRRPEPFAPLNNDIDRRQAEPCPSAGERTS